MGKSGIFTLGLCGAKNIFIHLNFFQSKKKKENNRWSGGVLNFPHASLSQCKKLRTKCHLPKAGEKRNRASFLL